MTPIPSDLISRVKAATGPNLDLDHALHDLFPDGDGAPFYTASIDAITGLIERRLPGSRVRIQNYTDDDPTTSMCTIGDNDSQYGHTPALAACAALLDAIQGTREHGHGG
jgi:hypothetical protein